MVKIIASQSLPARSEFSEPCDTEGVCASAPPAVLGDRLVGTPFTLGEAAAALARGELLPELTPAQRRLAEAYAQRA